MKIAVLSDIHANLPALEAVLADMDHRNPDAVFCLGDLVSYAPWPNEVIRLIRQRRIPTLMGNHDYDLGRLSAGQSLPTVLPTDKKWAGAQSLAFTHQTLGQAERIYLRGLSRHIRLEYLTPSGHSDILMVHGSPTSLTEYILEDRSDDQLHQLLDEAGAAVLLCGHSHLPYHKRLVVGQGLQAVARQVINTGSVGKPKDGDPRAGYVMLMINEPPESADQGSLDVELIRVDYDVEQAATAIEQSALPDELADRLRHAY